jgi:aspartyl-tRNA(Asn)/glutamyl-tRNA(Gln) amidotransferase subunit A
MVPMNRLADWDALDSDARRRRRDSARTIAHALDAELNSFVSISPPPAGAPQGALDGLPYAAKDMFRTVSHRPTGGLAQPGDLGIAEESDLLARLAAQGGDLIGFTQMTELAYEPSGFNASHGRVRNPWNPDFITGGSSSGSAAAVAGGAVVAALGSDTGGSLRIPAHACGITAWKPTHGAVSLRGAMALAPTLDTVGLLARSSADLMPLAGLMAELAPSAPIARAAMLDDVLRASDPAVRGAAVAAADAVAACGVAIDRKAALGVIDAIDPHALVIMQAESARIHRARVDDPALAPVLRRRLAKGLEIGDAALADSIGARVRLKAAFEQIVLGDCDIALLPVMPIATPTAAECDPESDRFSPKTLYALSRWTRFVNVLGVPAVAFPAGFDPRGMPVGVQIVGRAGSDLALLDLVRHVQRTTDWHGRIPTAVTHLHRARS